MKNYHAVLAKRSDAEEVLRLVNVEAKKDHLLTRSLKEIKSLIRRRRFFVVRINGKIAVCGSLEIPRFQEFRSFVAAPEFRGLRLSGKIARRVQREAMRRHLFQVMAVTSKTAIFKHWGYQFATRTERKAMFWFPGKKKQRNSKNFTKNRLR